MCLEELDEGREGRCFEAAGQLEEMYGHEHKFHFRFSGSKIEVGNTDGTVEQTLISSVRLLMLRGGIREGHSLAIIIRFRANVYLPVSVRLALLQPRLRPHSR